MNKLNYDKPQFMPILLDGASASNCAFKISYCEGVCAVDLGGGLGTVFNVSPSCYYTSKQAKTSVCFTTAGVNENVFGS